MTRTTRFLTVLLFSSSTMLFGCQSSIRPGAPPLTRAAAANYGQMPLSFEANHGQAKEPVQFLARGTNATLYLTPSEAALEVRSGQPTTNHQPPATALVKMKLLGANNQLRLQGQQELSGKSNYFSGNDPQAWKTDIPTYQKVKYEEVYDGIDLVYYGNQQQLEYDFIVQPGADPSAIKLNFEGAEEISLNEAGELVLQTAAGEVKQHRPVVYQEINGKRQEIAGNYVLAASSEVHFALGEYDTTQPLVIDPVIVYATFFGTVAPTTIAVDKDGNAVLAGQIAATTGAYQNGSGQSVVKLNASGTAVIFSATFITGEGVGVSGLALDAQGNIYVTGSTNTSLFPTTPGAFQTSFGLAGANFTNAFVMKLNAQGNQLLYSTYLKGDQVKGNAAKYNKGWSIAVDKDGNAYVAGGTYVLDFPVTPGAIQPQLLSDNKGGNAFVTKLNASGTGLLYSTYLGSGGTGDQATSLAIDVQGNAYVAGFTYNGWDGQNRPRLTPFPRTSGAYQTTDMFGVAEGFGVAYAFVSKINPSGTTLIYSTLVGSTYTPTNGAPQIAIDGDNCAYVTAATTSISFPTTPGVFKPQGGGETGDINVDSFVTKLNQTGSALMYSTYLGASQVDRTYGLAVDAEKNVYVAGYTISPDFPQIGGQSLTLPENGVATFVTKLNASASALISSQLLVTTRGYALAVDQNSNVYLTGAGFEGFQVTAGAFQTTPPSRFNSGFVAKISTPRSATTVDGAAYIGENLAAESIVSSFGANLALSTLSANSLPLPTTLAGTTVKVKDSSGTERAAQLFFVSPTQVNFQIPLGTVNGAAMITITNNDGGVSLSPVQIVNVKPSLFSADTTGRGIAAAHVQRAGSLTYEPVVKYDFTKGQYVALPIDLGAANEQVYLVLYGTGLRLRSSLSQVTATIGGTAATVSFAGAQPDFVGLDQVNVLIPRSLIGRGMVDVTLNVDGKPANTVKVSVK